MTTQPPRSIRSEYITKLMFIFLFLAGFGVVIHMGRTYGPGWDAFKIGAFDLLLLSLATFRLGRMIAYDRVTEPLRMPFTRTVQDQSGAGMTVIPKGVGFVRALGQLISCPICLGTWIAAILVSLLYFFPAQARVFLVTIAVVGGAEILHNGTEALCWSGVFSRGKSGELFRRKHTGDETEN